MRSNSVIVGSLFIVAALIAGCSSSGSSAAASAVAASQAPASVAPASAATGGGATVDVADVGTLGKLLVAANGMTVYTFTKDTKDSGKSACLAGCITKWPAVTVAAGGTPTAGSAATGKLGTITRDDGTLQVTYNGLPLYFFANDKAVGDANGVYANWEAVKP